MKTEKVIIFGAGKIGKRMCKKISDEGGKIIEIWDNGNRGDILCGHVIKKPHMYEELKEKPDRIIISMLPSYKNECIEQCLELNIPLDIIEMYTYYDKEIILQKYKNTKDFEIAKYLYYLKDNDLSMINEPYIKEYDNAKIDIYRDEEAGLFYTWYKNKKIYFKRSFSKRRCEIYMKSMLIEQDHRSPHCYLDENFFISKKSIVLDCGAAEGILGLDNIEEIEHLIMAECDLEWIEALNYTFKDYKDKVTFIEKKIGEIDTIDCITIDTILKDYAIDFIKMDIEGAEGLAIAGMNRFLEQDKNNKCVVCTYHKTEDAVNFEEIFKKNGYECYFQKGMVYICEIAEEGMITCNFDFRKAILRASKIVNI